MNKFRERFGSLLCIKIYVTRKLSLTDDDINWQLLTFEIEIYPCKFCPFCRVSLFYSFILFDLINLVLLNTHKTSQNPNISISLANQMFYIDWIKFIKYFYEISFKINKYNSINKKLKTINYQHHVIVNISNP